MKSFVTTAVGVACASLFGLSGCTIHMHGSSEVPRGESSQETAGAERTTPAAGYGATAGAPPTSPVTPSSPAAPGAVTGQTATPAPAKPVSTVDARGVVSAGVGSGQMPKRTPAKPVSAVDAKGVVSAGAGSVRTPTPAKPVSAVDAKGVVSAGVGAGRLPTPAPAKPAATADGKGVVDPRGAVSAGVVGGITPRPVRGINKAAGAGVSVSRPVPGAGVDKGAALGATVKQPTPKAGTGIDAKGVVAGAVTGPKLGGAPGNARKPAIDVKAGIASSLTARATKPTVTKDNGSNTREHGGAYALIPANGGDGRGQLNLPHSIQGLTCSLSQTTLAQGAEVSLRGTGFETQVKVTVGGMDVPVASKSPTLVTARLPQELANGGEVALHQGKVLVSCGQLTIKAAQ